LIRIYYGKGGGFLRQPPKNQISIRGLKVWRLQEIINSLIVLLIVIGVFVLSYFFDWPYWIGVVLAGLWLIVSVASIWIYPNMKHKYWRYEVLENEIDIQHGFLVSKRVIVPMVKVQHVDTSQGPLLRRFNLSTVEISTAATKHLIPALDAEEADQLRDFISRLARVTEDDV
jgi:membrane protein YdbS with pleckstrin-like domain